MISLTILFLCNGISHFRYLSLDPNDRSGHQARELKSIFIDSPATVVRLVFHNCYSNKLNTYSQVCNDP
jgi:hypothetical protein